MKRLKKWLLVLFILVLVAAASLFALDSWYKDYRSDIARLQGRWVCESTVHSEGASIVIEGCRVQNNNGSNSWYYIDWQGTDDLSVQRDLANLGNGNYQLDNSMRLSSHRALVTIDMIAPVQLANGFVLESGEYLVEMRNINELEMWREDDNPQGYRVRLNRQQEQFDLSVIASYLFGF
ncbi:MAG: hypothetical protein BroJett014_24440 [Planctomycetota bacterium]|nr:MAG: hypothetical protein BroJett014_24440 [Planctomycetota bacterium]